MVTAAIRENAWWRARARIFNNWVESWLGGENAGIFLKTDLFDEASGPHHHAQSGLLSATFLGIDNEFHIARAASRRLEDEQFPGLIITADVRALPIRDESIETIFSLSTLDHFAAEEEIEIALRELARVLQPAGRILLVLDNPCNFEVALRSVLPDWILTRIRRNKFPLGKTLDIRSAQSTFSRLGLVMIAEEYLVNAIRYPTLTLANLVDRQLWRRVDRWLEAKIVRRESLRGLLPREISAHYLAWVLRKGQELTGS